jgi:hypothetical protein
MPQTLLPTWARGGVGIIEGTGLDELHADSMWATWTCWLMPLMSITSPQKHLDRRSLVAWVACIPNPTSRISTLSRRGASGIRRSRPRCDQSICDASPATIVSIAAAVSMIDRLSLLMISSPIFLVSLSRYLPHSIICSFASSG